MELTNEMDPEKASEPGARSFYESALDRSSSTTRMCVSVTWNWISRTECGITETWIFTKDYIQFQSKRIKFHDITFSFKIIEIQFQTNNSNSNYVIKIQFFKAII